MSGATIAEAAVDLFGDAQLATRKGPRPSDCIAGRVRLQRYGLNGPLIGSDSMAVQWAGLGPELLPRA
jgi:hypothetical protein